MRRSESVQPDLRLICSAGARGVLAGLLATVIVACAQDSAADRLERAYGQIERGEYRVAVIELRNLVRDEPEHARAHLLLGQASLLAGDAEIARRALAAARDLGASPEDYATGLVEALARLGRYDEALIELERFDEASRDHEWLVAVGEIHAAEGRVDQADRAFRDALAREPGHYPAMVGLARTAASRQAWSDAYDDATQAIHQSPEQPDAWLVRGNVQLRTGNALAAEADLSRAAGILAEGPATSPEIDNLMVLTQLQLTLDRPEALQEIAALARGRSGGSVVALYAEGASHYLHGRYQEASRALQRAANEASDNVQVLMLLAASHSLLGNFGQAEQAVLSVLSQRPGEPSALRLLAETRRRQGRPEAALESLMQLPAADQAPVLLALRALLHLDLAQPAQSVPLFERALQALRSDPALRLHLARAYIAIDRRAAALALFAPTLGVRAERAVDTAVALLAGQTRGTGLDEARARADAAMAEAPDDAQAVTGAALYLHALGAGDDARRLLQRANELDPDFVAPGRLLAGLAFSDGNAVQARELYQSVVDRAPEDFRGWLGLARIAMVDEANDQAQRLAERAAAAAPGEVAPQLFLAQLAMSIGNAAGAAAAVDAALRVDGAHPDALTLAGMLALDQTQVELARTNFRRAAEADPRTAERWLNLSRAQRADGDTEAARQSLQRAVELTPGSGTMRAELARTELALGNLEAARELARSLQSDLPLDPVGYLLEGNRLAAAGNFTRAAALFDQAYELRPSFEIAVRGHQSRWAAAMDDASAPLRRWLDRTPEDARAWFLLAQFHQSAGEADAAMEAYERAIGLAPDDAVVLNNAAYLLNERGHPQALEYARRAYELAPEAAPILDTYGWTLVTQGDDIDTALSVLREAVRRGPQIRDIRYHLAFGLAQAGERAEARDLLETLLGSDGDFSYREEAAALLGEL